MRADVSSAKGAMGPMGGGGSKPELTGMSVLAGLVEPAGQVVEGLPAGDVVDEQGASSSPVVGPGDRAEGLLAGLRSRHPIHRIQEIKGVNARGQAGRSFLSEQSRREFPGGKIDRPAIDEATDRVPHLELDLFVIDGDHARAKFDADGQVVHWLEALVCELEQQTALADACGQRSTGKGECRTRRMRNFKVQCHASR